jgi:hypothetical protein
MKSNDFIVGNARRRLLTPKRAQGLAVEFEVKDFFGFERARSPAGSTRQVGGLTLRGSSAFHHDFNARNGL